MAINGCFSIVYYLFSQALANRGFNPSRVIFPISSAILERIVKFRDVLESYSSRLLPLIEWRPTDSFNVEVTNDTGDFLRIFDATPNVEFFYSCVRKTIAVDIPYETGFLRLYGRFRSSVEDMFDKPERTIDLLFRVLSQNDRRLSARAHGKEFFVLSDTEIERVETAYREAFVKDRGSKLR